MLIKIDKKSKKYICLTSLKKYCIENAFKYDILHEYVIMISRKDIIDCYYKINESKDTYYINKSDIDKLFNYSKQLKLWE